MQYDIAIIGGGKVGLATGCQLLNRHPDLNLVFLEKETAIVMHQIDLNSRVIHSGICYKPSNAKSSVD